MLEIIASMERLRKMQERLDAKLGTINPIPEIAQTPKRDSNGRFLKKTIEPVIDNSDAI
jgi:hypothetical protein